MYSNWKNEKRGKHRLEFLLDQRTDTHGRTQYRINSIRVTQGTSESNDVDPTSLGRPLPSHAYTIMQALFHVPRRGKDAMLSIMKKNLQCRWQDSASGRRARGYAMLSMYKADDQRSQSDRDYGARVQGQNRDSNIVFVFDPKAVFLDQHPDHNPGSTSPPLVDPLGAVMLTNDLSCGDTLWQIIYHVGTHDQFDGRSLFILFNF